MKNFIIASAAAIAFGAAVEATAEELTKFETCKAYHELSSTLMEAHQIGVSMPKALEALEGDSLSVEILQEAYSYPRFSTERYREEAKRDFSDKVYANCLKSFD